MKVNEQKTADKMWQDEKGTRVPVDRVHQNERFKEKAACKIAREALKTNNALEKFKTLCVELTEKAYQEDLKANKAPTKGGYTLYNFDRSIKIERSLNERIEFDDNLIKTAKEKFDDFLQAGTGSVEEVIRQMIMDAFSNTRKGKMDTKKVLHLLSYRDRISAEKYPTFHQALNLIEESIRRPDSKTYYRISIKQDGEYKSVELNFSNI